MVVSIDIRERRSQSSTVVVVIFPIHQLFSIFNLFVIQNSQE
jgi:hypothetical protein